MHVRYWEDEGRIDEDINDGKPYWYCWLYFATSEERVAFIDWAYNNMTDEDEFCHRFNSGNPMTEVTITDEHRAMMFKITYSEYL